MIIAVWLPELHTLDWLVNSLDLNAANDKEIVADYGLGRNCTLFDKTRKWAYHSIRQSWTEYDQWLQVCYEHASAYNLQHLWMIMRLIESLKVLLSGPIENSQKTLFLNMLKEPIHQKFNLLEERKVDVLAV